ncbi:MAG: NAAT family transporter [Candidatus Eisenbacteria bacterium]|nr:NAAT family transporter [Candidatus Eisenbacteria bacterium]
MPELGVNIWSAAVVLFFVMDPLGNLPVMLSLLKEMEPRRRRLVILRELFFALAILLLFLFLGQAILDFLDLRQESVTIAGGIVLLVIGLRMIFPLKHHGVMGDQPGGEPFLVPLAVPLIAGPSAMATLILMVRSAPEQLWSWLVALLVAWLTTAVILMMGPFLYRVLRVRGLAAVERLMGMLLLMIAVQMVLNGISALQF